MGERQAEGPAPEPTGAPPGDPSPPGRFVGRGALTGAFAAIVVGGLSGATIGSGLVGFDCAGDCTTAEGVGAVLGGALGAAGVAVVAVLVLRALAEWRRQDPARPMRGPRISRRK